MKKQFLFASALLFTCCLMMVLASTVWAQPAQQEPALNKAVASKIVQMLEESGHSYAKASGNVWTVKFKGNNLQDVNVIVVGTDTMLVLVSVLAEKQEFKTTPESLTKLLRLNDDYDRVKVCIDDDGSVILRVDITMRITDAKEFKENVEQMSAATDEIYAVIKPFLVVPKKTGK